MFLHNYKYELLTTLKKKEVVMWVIIFPIILGTLFKVAFGNILEESKFKAVPVCVVEEGENLIFDSVLEEVSQGDNPLFKVTRCDEKTAIELLKNKKVEGIIYNKSLSMTTDKSDVPQTVIKCFLEEYKASESVIMDTMITNPQKLEAVTKAISSEIHANEKLRLTDGKWDEMIGYFYNLIAMTALFCSYIGISICINNQANISALGARKSVSPVRKSLSLTSSLCACFTISSVCMVFCVTFLRFGLGVYFGNRLLLVYLSAILAGALGVALGFFVGAIGKMGLSAKIGLLTVVSLFLCFLSGLMVSNMKAVMDDTIPWFNDVNPAAVISDSFYCLNIYSDYRVFTAKVITMAMTTILLLFGGFILTRKRKFRSL